MSVPATPQAVPGPAATPVPPAVRPAPPAHVTQLRESLRHVLAELRFPARRWQVVAEADSWGVGGPLRQAIGRLPDGSYPSLSVILDVLTGPAAQPPAPSRVVVPMRATTKGPRRPA